MPLFNDIIGHDSVKRHLMDGIKYNKISHAYILNGDIGSGKKMLASTFAMALQCERGEQEPCMICHSCKQALSGNHPDIIWLKQEKTTSIGVTEVREQLNSDILIKPYSSKYKIYILDEAEKLTVQAQNAILKTIEEPPQYAVIIFLTTNADTFLPTILSRCTRLDLKEIEAKKIREYIKDNYNVPDYQASFLTQFSQGSIGRAITLATNGNIMELKDEVVSVLKYIDQMTISEITKAIKEAEKYKLTANDYIDFMILWYRDILIFKATSDANTLIYRDELNTIKKQSESVSYEGIDRIIASMEKAKIRLKSNVNFELTMELMLLTLKENSNK